MKILAVANQKGGVGKSTVCVGTAYAAIESGKRVLLVDFDRQGSLSTSFLSTDSDNENVTTASQLFAENTIIHPEVISPELSILRADDTLSLLSGVNQEGIKRPARYLKELSRNYDVCIIDTPGVLGLNPPMTIAALVAANAVVCPFGVGLYEGKALSDLWEYLGSVRTNGYNPKLRLMGLLPSKVHTSSREEMEALDGLRAQFGKVILPLILGERASVKQAIAKRKPVWKGTRGAGHLKAANEWRAATQYILSDLGVI